MPRCPVCSKDLASDPQIACKVCDTPHHRTCWDYGGGCAVFACRPIPADPIKKVPPIEPVGPIRLWLSKVLRHAMRGTAVGLILAMVFMFWLLFTSGTRMGRRPSVNYEVKGQIPQLVGDSVDLPVRAWPRGGSFVVTGEPDGVLAIENLGEQPDDKASKILLRVTAKKSGNGTLRISYDPPVLRENWWSREIEVYKRDELLSFEVLPKIMGQVHLLDVIVTDAASHDFRFRSSHHTQDERYGKILPEHSNVRYRFLNTGTVPQKIRMLERDVGSDLSHPHPSMNGEDSLEIPRGITDFLVHLHPRGVCNLKKPLSDGCQCKQQGVIPHEKQRLDLEVLYPGYIPRRRIAVGKIGELIPFAIVEQIVQEKGRGVVRETLFTMK